MAGRLISMYVDGRTVKINKEFKCKFVTGYVERGEILEPNPIEALGLPLPSDFLIVGYRFEKEAELGRVTVLPIAENILIKVEPISNYFEDEVRRLLKEEEAVLLLEGTIFHEQLERSASDLRGALLSFSQESFAHAKTSCRKVLEKIKQIVGGWKSVDGSESLCEKLKSIVSSLYSFASIGGPHEGVVTREETDLILKCTTSLLMYVNSILKNQRATPSPERPCQTPPSTTTPP